MPWRHIIWTDWARRKIAEHGVTEAEVEQVILSPIEEMFSRSTGSPMARGFTAAGRRLVVVYGLIDAITVEIITAYEA